MVLQILIGAAVAVLIAGAILFILAGRKRKLHAEEFVFITPDVAGTFTWKLSPRATKLLEKYGDGIDPTFAEHYVNKLLLLMMASMVASTPERKKAARAIIEEVFVEFENRMEAELCTKKEKRPDDA